MPCTQTQRAIISRAYMDMPGYHHNFTDCKRELLRICTEEERKHRKANPEHKYYMTVDLAAKYFACKWMAKRALIDKPLTAKSLLSERLGAFYAAAVVEEVKEQNWPLHLTMHEWACDHHEELDCLDYAEMVKP